MKFYKVTRPSPLLTGVFLVMAIGGLLTFFYVREQSLTAFVPSDASALMVRDIHGMNLVEVESNLLRVAERLHDRLQKNNRKVLSLMSLVNAVTQRREYLRRDLSLKVTGSDGIDFGTFDVSISSHPLWLLAVQSGDALFFRLDENGIERYMQTLTETIPRPVDSTISVVKDDNGVLRVTADKPAEPGYEWDENVVAEGVVHALNGTGTVLALMAQAKEGAIINATGRDLGDMKFLASGRSNFAGSGDGRIWNVRKGLADFVNGVLVPAGGTFSFDAVVQNMTLSAGWKEAQMIVNGHDLAPIPGGGICQVATTTYRAALHAGLKITERAPHSLYVSYYEKYGVGLDATVLPYKQDLTFVNDTSHDILVQAYSRGFEATVSMYGTPDGRSVTLQGPYFNTSTDSPLFTLLKRSLQSNEIGWVQTIRYADGHEHQEALLSRYLSIPSRLRSQYAAADNQQKGS